MNQKQQQRKHRTGNATAITQSHESVISRVALGQMRKKKQKNKKIRKTTTATTATINNIQTNTHTSTTTTTTKKNNKPTGAPAKKHIWPRNPPTHP
jgi:hypothetical protein